ncbi:enolase-phosphatase E1 [Methylomagnum ishizawai]|uniref:Enolase-phosphatase E1 n=1 Tax=Methylomagnum ishizawai TaxID=1760988 RepID=A0A1Y6CYP5_9GAMM|nr:acireductone synthase [Methylomagnum ishizawai]SMF95788.1 enolase-phosphatase E1 [Methylomagnum ishizawai]
MIKAILTDIEGTTSSLSFVKDVLFPYARERLPGFVRAHGDDPEVVRLLDETSALGGFAPECERAIAQLLAWIAEDRKAPPLKALQGMIWAEGYRSGAFFGHVYEDAARKLKEWHAAGLALYVFSSGSVQAQQLLFAHTGYGDLTPLFSGYFDTRTGPKQAPDAYRAIARQIGLEPGAILFLSDIVAELDAARAAGFATRWLVRGPARPGPAIHPAVPDFDAIAEIA